MNFPVTEGNKDIIYKNDETAAIPLSIAAPTVPGNGALTVTINTLPDAGVGTIWLDGQPLAAHATLSVAQLGRLQFVPGHIGLLGSLIYTVSGSDGGATTSTITLQQLQAVPDSATLHFDDPLLPLTQAGDEATPVPAGYGSTGNFAGFTWSHIGLLSNPPYPNPFSAPNIAYGDDTASTISSANGSEFTVNSLQVGRLFGATQITLTGYDFNHLVGSVTYNLPGGDFSGVWALAQPDFGPITSLTIQSNLGNWKIDDLSFSSVPTYMGGVGNDILVGSGQDDRFHGGSGNDTITGNAGNDTAIYSGNRVNYVVTYNAATQSFTIADQRAGSPDGVDTVSGVEQFQFADGTISAAALIGTAPTDAIWTGGTVAENAANGTVVGKVSGIDPDPFETLSYSLVSSAGGRFAIDAQTGTLTVANATLLDHTSGAVHTIVVRMTDHAGLTLDKSITIGVTGGTPSLSVQNTAGNAGSAIALSIATAPNSTQTLSIGIAGLPSGATLSAGTHNADGSWTLTPAQLSSLSVTVPSGSFAGTANLIVTSTATATDGSVAASSASLKVVVAGTVSTYDSQSRLSSVTVANLDGTMSVTNYDPGNSQPWTTQVFAYNSTGGLVSLTVNNDDGTRSVTSYDAANSQSWTTQISAYDSSNQLVSLTVNNDDATQSVTYYDASGFESWTTQVFAYDATGALTAQTVNNDDGTKYATTYDTLNILPWTSEVAFYDSLNRVTFLTVNNDDLTSSGTEYDVANSQPWTTQVSVYDSFGSLASVTTNNDDGTQSGDNSDGSHWSTVADRADAYNWSSFRIDYDAFGSMTSQTIVNDNLTRVVNAYDPENAASWTSSTTLYDSAGRIVSQAGLNDDGTHWLTANDNANAYSWATFTITYDANWTPLTQTGTNHDGTHNLDAGQIATALDTLTWYPTPYSPIGNLTPQTGTNPDGTKWSILTDIADVYGWSTITKNYTAGGVLTSLNGTNDGGSSWSNVYDVAGTQTYSWYVNLYDGSGNLFTQSGTNDNGTHWITANDLTNQYGWSTFTNTYGSNWILLTQTGTNDDGSHTMNAGAISAALDVLPWYSSTYDPTPTAPPGSGAPTLTVQNASGSAGAPIALSIATALLPSHAQDVLSVKITGVPSGATLSAGTHNSDGSWTLTPAQLSNLRLTVPAGSFAGLANLTVVSTDTGFEGATASTSASLQVVIAGVATAPSLSVQIASGNAGSLIPLSIASALTATDGQETLSVRITGLPPGALLSAGTHNSDGSWTLTASQLGNLRLLAAAATTFDGIANLTVTSNATETNGSTASSSALLKVIVAGSVSTRDSLNRVTSTTTVNLDGTKTVTNYDVTNSQPWANQVFAYDSAGNLTSVATNNDDGTQSGTRPNGTHWTTDFDNAHQFNWSSIRLEYDAAGNMTSQTTVLDFLSQFVNAYDPTNAAPWTSSTTVYDAAGHIESQAGLYDDGRHWITGYDTANSYSFANFTNTYDSDWNLVSQTGTNDDGTHTMNAGEISAAMDTLVWYSSPYSPMPVLTPQTGTNPNGTKYSILTDTADVYGWSTITKNFTAGGVLTSLNGTNDGGSSWSNVYDAANNQTYTWYINVYDSSGQLFVQSGTNDNGTHWVSANDLTNQYGWSTFTNTYDASWNLVTQTGTNDDGTHTMNAGNIAAALDVLPWYAAPYDPTPAAPPEQQPGDGLPVILDLDGNGVNLSPLGESTATFDMADNGQRVATAWAGAGDGFLAIDLGADGQAGPDGVIDQSREIAFAQWAPGSASDMQALRQVFDTNHNGELDSGDARWSEFRIWQDADGNGVSNPGEIRTLDQLGITAIGLNPAGPAQYFSDGSVIQGLSTYSRADGSSGLAGDVSLAYGAISSQLNQLIQAMATSPVGGAGLDMVMAGNAQLPGDQAPAMIAPSWH